MIRDAIHREHAYWHALATDGNLPDPDDAHERQHEGGDPATEAQIDGVQYVDEQDDWDASVPF